MEIREFVKNLREHFERSKRHFLEQGGVQFRGITGIALLEYAESLLAEMHKPLASSDPSLERRWQDIFRAFEICRSSETILFRFCPRYYTQFSTKDWQQITSNHMEQAILKVRMKEMRSIMLDQFDSALSCIDGVSSYGGDG